MVDQIWNFCGGLKVLYFDCSYCSHRFHQLSLTKLPLLYTLNGERLHRSTKGFGLDPTSVGRYREPDTPRTVRRKRLVLRGRSLLVLRAPPGGTHRRVSNVQTRFWWGSVVSGHTPVCGSVWLLLNDRNDGFHWKEVITRQLCLNNVIRLKIWKKRENPFKQIGSLHEDPEVTQISGGEGAPLTIYV